MKRKYLVREFVKTGEKEYTLTKYRDCFTKYGVFIHFNIWYIKHAWKQTLDILRWGINDPKMLQIKSNNNIFQLEFIDK